MVTKFQKTNLLFGIYKKEGKLMDANKELTVEKSNIFSKKINVSYIHYFNNKNNKLIIASPGLFSRYFDARNFNKEIKNFAGSFIEKGFNLLMYHPSIYEDFNSNIFNFPPISLQLKALSLICDSHKILTKEICEIVFIGFSLGSIVQDIFINSCLIEKKITSISISHIPLITYLERFKIPNEPKWPIQISEKLNAKISFKKKWIKDIKKFRKIKSNTAIEKSIIFQGTDDSYITYGNLKMMERYSSTNIYKLDKVKHDFNDSKV